MNQNKSKIHTFTLLFFLIITAVVVGNILPAGKYEKKIISGREIIDPNKYSVVESDRPNISDIFLALPRGLSKSADLVFCFLIIGGALGVLTKVGLVEAIISKLVGISIIPNLLLIAILMTFFSIGGGTLGIAGEIILFLPGLVFFARRLGYDEITGASIAILGAGAGVAGAFVSPFTVGLAQQLAGLPLYSALGFRLIVWLVITAVTILFVLRYAQRHRITPEITSENKILRCHNARLQFMLMVAGIVMIAVGTIQLKWGLIELSAAYLAIAVCIAVAGRLTATDTAQAFADGASRMVSAALVVGFARSVPLILEDANVIDTILHSLAASIQKLPGGAQAAGIFVFQLLVSFIIPSGTGQAVLTIPILSPLGDIVGVTRQTIVLAYQFGDSFSNVLSPNVGYFIAALSAVNIPWSKWAKFVLPLFFIWCLIGLTFTLIAYYIHLGPF
jgi:uncharacterized ion transporter superfamily protein YfcC